MNLGVVVADGPWRFFNEIYAEFQKRYTVSLFERRRVQTPFFYTRVNRYLFKHDLNTFLSRQDVVFFEWASRLLVEATKLPKKTRLITRLHRFEMYEWADQVDWNKLDRIILVSRAMQKKFAERFPENAHKTVVLSVGIDTSRFTREDKQFSGDIGTLCYLSPRKRVYELILAFAELNKRRKGFHLHIGGGGNKFEDYNEALESLVHKLRLQDKVTFYGNVASPADWYRNIDIFVSNSFSEGLQVAAMEAMASGCYTLSHYWDGADELLPKSHLYLTDSELQDKILEYSEQSDAARQVEQEKMRERARNCFDMEQINEQILDLVEDISQMEVRSTIAANEMLGGNRLRQG